MDYLDVSPAPGGSGGPPPAAEPPRRLTGPYALGLAAVAMLAVAGALVLSVALADQKADARVVRQAAAQVTRSYELSRAVAAGNDVNLIATDLEATHVGLLLGSDALGLPRTKSPEIQAGLDAVTPPLYRMLDIAAGDGAERLDELENHASAFREGMEAVVFRYQLEAENGVFGLQKTQFAILAATLVLLTLEGLLLFRRAERRAQRSWRERARRHADERAADQAQIEFLAHFDPLTGLVNRSLFGDRLDQAVARARRQGELVTVMFLDLDDFKAVNTRFGQSVGDAVLVATGERLVQSLRESDTVAHLGADAFGIILSGTQRVEVAGAVAEKVLAGVAQPLHLEGHEIVLSASVGVVMYPLDGDQSEDLLRDAAMAMHAAKDAGRNTYQFYTEQLRRQTSERLALADQLRRSVAANELELAYQPKISIATGEVVGVEALCRWSHSELGPVPPSRFIPIAEQSDLIIDLSRWVLRTACAQAQAWREAGYDILPVSVNVSARQFRRGDLVEEVSLVLAETGLDPRWLELELTEGTLLEDSELTQRTLERLRETGVQIAVDDFGTGFSSLAYLQRFSIDALKIDQSFIAEMNPLDDVAAIPAAIIGLGQNLELRVIAEGVETSQQLASLHNLGCEEAQGFLISRPLPPESVLPFVANRAMTRT